MTLWTQSQIRPQADLFRHALVAEPNDQNV
jgi:hypothetical protein